MRGNAASKIVGMVALLLALGFVGFAINMYISNQSGVEKSQPTKKVEEDVRQTNKSTSENRNQTNIPSPDTTDTVFGSRKHVLSTFKSCNENNVRPMKECLQKHYDIGDVAENEIAFLFLLDPEIEQEVEIRTYLVDQSQDEYEYEHLEAETSKHSLAYMSGEDSYYSELRNEELTVCIEFDDGERIHADTYSYFSQDPSSSRYLESVVAWNADFGKVNVTEIDQHYFEMSAKNDPQECEEAA